MSKQNFWNGFWKNRCVTLDDSEPEVDTAAAATKPPAGAGHETEGDYDEYSAMLDGVIEASEAALKDGRERKRRLHQRLQLTRERIRSYKRTPSRDRRTPTRRTPTRDRRTPTRSHKRTSSRDRRTPRNKRASNRDRRAPTRRTPTRDVYLPTPTRSTPTRDVDRVPSGSVMSGHTRQVYFKVKEAT